MRELLEPEVLDAGSWQVKRIEEYIESAPRCPVRHRADCRSHRHQHPQHLPRLQAQPGYSPMAFAHQRRLQRARQMLEDQEMNRP